MRNQIPSHYSPCEISSGEVEEMLLMEELNNFHEQLRRGENASIEELAKGLPEFLRNEFCDLAALSVFVRILFEESEECGSDF